MRVMLDVVSPLVWDARSEMEDGRPGLQSGAGPPLLEPLPLPLDEPELLPELPPLEEPELLPLEEPELLPLEEPELLPLEEPELLLADGLPASPPEGSWLPASPVPSVPALLHPAKPRLRVHKRDALAPRRTVVIRADLVRMRIGFSPAIVEWARFTEQGLDRMAQIAQRWPSSP